MHIENLAGHKLPTGFPSRRVWVRLEVRDAQDRVLFVSGDFDKDGRITDAAGRVLDSELAGGPVQPHYARITASSQVQIYESVMADKTGNATFTLAAACGVISRTIVCCPVDGRANIPTPIPSLPAGVTDDDFRGGHDVVWYEVPLDPSVSVTIHASLHYQSIGVRHVSEVFSFDTPEVRAFRNMYEAADRTPETLDQTTK